MSRQIPNRILISVDEKSIVRLSRELRRGRKDNRGFFDSRSYEISDYQIKGIPFARRGVVGSSIVIVGMNLISTLPYSLEERIGSLILDFESLESNEETFVNRDNLIRRRIELGRIIDKSIRGGDYINFDALIDTRDPQQVYTIKIDVQIIQDDAGIIDLCVAMVTDIFLQVFESELFLEPFNLRPGTIINYDNTPTSYTFGLTSEQIILDPSNEEQAALIGLYQVSYAQTSRRISSVQLVFGRISSVQQGEIFNWLENQ